MPTVREARRLLAQSLMRAGSASPGLDARLLVEGSLGVENADPDLILTAEALARLGDFAARRIAGEPVWRILGEREFWGCPSACRLRRLSRARTAKPSSRRLWPSLPGAVKKSCNCSISAPVPVAC